MPFAILNETPLAPGRSAVRVFYRRTGGGAPLVFLHGGWGYEIYPFRRQIESLASRFQIIIPDRSGYGKSTRIEEFPVDFHHRAAEETFRFLDALGIERPVLWGHSDGAVIATLMGLSSPSSFSGLILEAFHFYRVKPASREFFETMVEDPVRLGERVCETLAREHGEDYWRKLIENNGRAWLELAEQSSHPKEDLYGGRLSGLSVPAIFIHGSRDPRTEPGELSAIREQLPHTPVHVIEGGGHSPHSERAAADEATRLAADFLTKIAK